MALAKVLHADVLLLDDQRARKAAELNGLRVAGSLGVLLRAKRLGLITAIRPRVDACLIAGIYYSDQLVSEALRLAGER